MSISLRIKRSATETTEPTRKLLAVASASDRAQRALAEAERRGVALLLSPGSITGYSWVYFTPRHSQASPYQVRMDGVVHKDVAIKDKSFATAEEAALAIALDPTIQARLRAAATGARDETSTSEYWHLQAKKEGLELQEAKERVPPFTGVSIQDRYKQATPGGKLATLGSTAKIYQAKINVGQKTVVLGGTHTAEEASLRYVRARVYKERMLALGIELTSDDLKQAALTPASPAQLAAAPTSTSASASASSPRPASSSAPAPAPTTRGAAKRTRRCRAVPEAEAAEEGCAGADSIARRVGRRGKRVRYPDEQAHKTGSDEEYGSDEE